MTLQCDVASLVVMSAGFVARSPPGWKVVAFLWDHRIHFHCSRSVPIGPTKVSTSDGSLLLSRECYKNSDNNRPRLMQLEQAIRRPISHNKSPPKSDGQAPSSFVWPMYGVWGLRYDRACFQKLIWLDSKSFVRRTSVPYILYMD